MCPFTRTETISSSFRRFQSSKGFRECPLKVRTELQRVYNWLPTRQASFPITQVDATFARMLRDKAARDRGWKSGNYALLLLQAIIKASVDAGMLSNNRVKQV